MMAQALHLAFTPLWRRITAMRKLAILPSRKLAFVQDGKNKSQKTLHQSLLNVSKYQGPIGVTEIFARTIHIRFQATFRRNCHPLGLGPIRRRKMPAGICALLYSVWKLTSNPSMPRCSPGHPRRELLRNATRASCRIARRACRVGNQKRFYFCRPTGSR